MISLERQERDAQSGDERGVLLVSRRTSQDAYAGSTVNFMSRAVQHARAASTVRIFFRTSLQVGTHAIHSHRMFGNRCVFCVSICVPASGLRPVLYDCLTKLTP